MSAFLFLFIFTFICREERKWFLEKHPEKLIPMLGKLYIFAYTWAFGGVLTREDEQEGDSLIGLKARDELLVNVTYDFSNFVHDLFEGEQARGKKSLTVFVISIYNNNAILPFPFLLLP